MCVMMNNIRDYQLQVTSGAPLGRARSETIGHIYTRQSRERSCLILDGVVPTNYNECPEWGPHEVIWFSGAGIRSSMCHHHTHIIPHSSHFKQRGHQLCILATPSPKCVAGPNI